MHKIEWIILGAWNHRLKILRFGIPLRFLYTPHFDYMGIGYFWINQRFYGQNTDKIVVYGPAVHRHFNCFWKNRIFLGEWRFQWDIQFLVWKCSPFLENMTLKFQSLLSKPKNVTAKLYENENRSISVDFFAIQNISNRLFVFVVYFILNAFSPFGPRLQRKKLF